MDAIEDEHAEPEFRPAERGTGMRRQQEHSVEAGRRMDLQGDGFECADRGRCPVIGDRKVFRRVEKDDKARARIVAEEGIDERRMADEGDAFEFRDVAGSKAGLLLDHGGIDANHCAGVAEDEHLAISMVQRVSVAKIGEVGVSGMQREPARGDYEEGTEQQGKRKCHDDGGIRVQASFLLRRDGYRTLSVVKVHVFKDTLENGFGCSLRVLRSGLGADTDCSSPSIGHGSKGGWLRLYPWD